MIIEIETNRVNLITITAYMPPHTSSRSQENCKDMLSVLKDLLRNMETKSKEIPLIGEFNSTSEGETLDPNFREQNYWRL